ncbi:MAG: hypothetical protein ACOVPA_13450, partial [Rubrivivax sp.]
GSYTIDASALANSNYLITAQNGRMTINESTDYNAALALVRSLTASTRTGGDTSAGISVADPLAVRTSALSGAAEGNPGLRFDAVTDEPQSPSPGAISSPQRDTRSGPFLRVRVLRGGINVGVEAPSANEPQEIQR